MITCFVLLFKAVVDKWEVLSVLSELLFDLTLFELYLPAESLITYQYTPLWLKINTASVGY